jgi:hypothetical protein
MVGARSGAFFWQWKSWRGDGLSVGSEANFHTEKEACAAAERAYPEAARKLGAYQPRAARRRRYWWDDKD